jgi:hypothetical protein
MRTDTKDRRVETKLHKGQPIAASVVCCPAAFLASLKNRRVQAVFKYWSVLTLLMVGTLLLMYFVPLIGRFNPSFGFTAAAVGMSDRVESTLFKVSALARVEDLAASMRMSCSQRSTLLCNQCLPLNSATVCHVLLTLSPLPLPPPLQIAVWTGATIVGAAVGWAIMATPSMAFNPAAICAVVCAVAFCVGTMDRGHGHSGSLLALFTLTTLASIVMCQCCGHLGVTWVSVTRGASVLVAAVITLAVQNLVLPWYTSTWALEQLGYVYKEATEVLADMVCQLYEDTEKLLQQYEAEGSSSNSSAGCLGGPAAAAAAAATAADGTAATNLRAVDEHSDAAAVSGSAPAAVSPMQRLQLLDVAVRKVWLAQQELQHPGSEATTSEQQQQQPAAGQPSRSTSAAAASRLATLGHMFTGSGSLEDLLQPSKAKLAAEPLSQGLATQPARSSSSSSAGRQPVRNSSADGKGRTAATSMAAAEAAAAIGSALADEPAADQDAALCEMVQLLQQRRLAHRQQQQEGSGSGRVGVTGLQLQSRLVRPLVQIKISLMLDTTAWTSGPLATPPVSMCL